MVTVSDKKKLKLGRLSSKLIKRPPEDMLRENKKAWTCLYIDYLHKNILNF